MTSFIKKLRLFRRKTQILLVFVLLSACDGGALQLANGVGGTGITVGRLTAFGSMFVNGVKFNTDNATFVRDGVGSRSQGDFSTGEIVKINGTIDSNKTTGTATEVIFTDLLEGVVTKVATAKSLEVLGQKVRTDSLTVLHGFEKLSDLKLENVVEVSGFSINNEILASSIKLISERYVEGSSFELEGPISNLNRSAQTFSINNLTVGYSTTEFVGLDEGDINNDQYVTVSTKENINNGTLSALVVILSDEELEADTYYEIEGYVTRFTSASDFELDDYPVETNMYTTYSNGTAADISMDSHLIISGVVNSQNILVADKIKVLNADDEVLLEANIESINVEEQSVTLLGLTVDVDSFTLLSDETIEDSDASLDLTDFSIGDSVFVSGRSIDGSFFADRLSKIDTIPNSFMSGVASSIDRGSNEIVLSGIQVVTDGATLYFDQDLNEVSATVFFSRVEENTTALIVEGNSNGGTAFLATELQITVNEY